MKIFSMHEIFFACVKKKKRNKICFEFFLFRLVKLNQYFFLKIFELPTLLELLRFFSEFKRFFLNKFFYFWISYLLYLSLLLLIYCNKRLHLNKFYFFCSWFCCCFCGFGAAGRFLFLSFFLKSAVGSCLRATSWSC